MKIKSVFLAAILTAVLCISGNLLAYSGDGDGSVGNPYQIANVPDFQQFSATPGDWVRCFILTADIDLVRYFNYKGSRHQFAAGVLGIIFYFIHRSVGTRFFKRILEALSTVFPQAGK